MILAALEIGVVQVGLAPAMVSIIAGLRHRSDSRPRYEKHHRLDH